MPLKQYIIDSIYGKDGLFSKGLINQTGDDAVPEGAVIDGLNWTIKQDKVELRRGQLLLGVDAGVGGITGLRVARDIAGTDQLFKARARKLEYYTLSTNLWAEIGTNSLPVVASGEDIAMEPYTSLAGYAIYMSSPNSDIYKVMLANKDDLISMSSTNHKGKIKIHNNAMFLWDRKSTTGSKDKTGVYRSKLDKDVYSDYTSVSTENVGTGDGSAKTFTDTLAFKAGGAKRSCFGITATDTVETFNDNFDGTLTGDKGGTGTINYATGAISLTFNTAPAGAQAITADYFWEDPTSGGIVDFAFSGTRVASEGFVVRQDSSGGNMMSIEQYNAVYYCLHEKRTWKLEVSADDADANNLPFRDQAGIPYWRGSTATGEGIYFIDDSDDNDVRLRVLQVAGGSTEVIPISVSNGINLSGFRFDKAVVKEWGDFIVIACRRASSTKNDRMFFYDRRLKLWHPPTDYQANCLEIYNGTLVGGDSTTNNVFQLQSGVDDDDSNIANFITFNQTNLQAEGLKFARRFIIKGEIQPDQLLKIQVSLDGGSFIDLGEVDGRGEYVDQGINVQVGSNTVGSKEVGGGSDGMTAHPYQREINISGIIDKFEKIQIKFEATKLGFVSISRYGFKDIRRKGRRLPTRFVS